MVGLFTAQWLEPPARPEGLHLHRHYQWLYRFDVYLIVVVNQLVQVKYRRLLQNQGHRQHWAPLRASKGNYWGWPQAPLYLPPSRPSVQQTHQQRQ